jgi:hypothetical protein
MPLTICPTNVAHAPASVLWTLLTEPESYEQWMDARVRSVSPPGRVRPRQDIILGAPARAPIFRCRLVIEAVDEERQVLTVAGEFPFGLRIRNRLSIAPLDARTTRIAFG